MNCPFKSVTQHTVQRQCTRSYLMLWTHCSIPVVSCCVLPVMLLLVQPEHTLNLLCGFYVTLRTSGLAGWPVKKDLPALLYTAAVCDLISFAEQHKVCH